MTVCRVLQKVGWSGWAYKMITGEKGCLLRQINAVEVAWIVSIAILLLKLLNVLHAALAAVNEEQNCGDEAKLLRVASLIRRSQNFLRILVTLCTLLFFADAIGLPVSHPQTFPKRKTKSSHPPPTVEQGEHRLLTRLSAFFFCS